MGAQWPDFRRVLPRAHAGLGPESLLLSQDPLRLERQWPRCLLFSSHPEQSSVGYAFAGFSIRDFPPWTEQESFKIIHEKLMAVLSAGGFAGHGRPVGEVKSREGKTLPPPPPPPLATPLPCQFFLRPGSQELLFVSAASMVMVGFSPRCLPPLRPRPRSCSPRGSAWSLEPAPDSGLRPQSGSLFCPGAGLSPTWPPVAHPRGVPAVPCCAALTGSPWSDSHGYGGSPWGSST